jgi:hypothetical protein
VLIIIVTCAVLGLIVGPTTSTPAKNSKGGPSVSIGYNANSVQVTNNGSADWTVAVVYINGTPPFTFKATVDAPEVGKTISIPLSSFVTKSGDRFDPRTKALTEIWIGGSDYDFKKFTTR